VGCVYGDLTARVAERVCAGGRLDVADVLPVQLENLARKLVPGAPVRLVHGDSTRLPLATESYDRALLFFLLHEQPEQARRATVGEALRLVKPGGHLAIVDYHRPRRWHPLYWPMVAILRLLEPYALDLWRDDIEKWLPRPVTRIERVSVFGGLYQVVRITV
jgi:ubiquinone/menaquinone biosynthesis C-methylase UbiE